MLQFKCKAKVQATGEEIIGFFYVTVGGIQRVVDEGRCFDIVPNSQRRFIAFDKNKKPVFEGDEVKSDDKSYPALFSDYDGIINGKVVKACD